MPLQKIQLRPGVVRDQTSYTNEGGWRESNLVRFRLGFPETVGGWLKFSRNSFYGTCRSLFPWVALDNSSYLGIGTSLKFYIEYGSTYYDVTPIRKTSSLSNPFTATDGSKVIAVASTAHGCIVGDFVTFSGATSLGGNITATVLNKNQRVTKVIDDNNYEITVTATASASDTNKGGTSVVAQYELTTGTDAQVTGAGWGYDGWGVSPWGRSSPYTQKSTLRIWSQDNYGEDLIFCVRNGSIFYWDKTGTLEGRAVSLRSLTSDPACPTLASQVMVSDRDRHVIAFGADYGDGNADPMAIRFSSQEDPFTWTSTATNTAGDLRLGSGSAIVRAVETKRSILVFTDTSLYSMQYLGPPYTFGVEQISSNITIMGYNAAAALDDTVYWMGRDSFYVYNGQTLPLPCPLKDYVFGDFNIGQSDKVFAGTNTAFNEVTWFYPSSDSLENDRYVTYNYAEQVWTYGELGRTAWLDRGIREYPIAAQPYDVDTSYLYNHELGRNDDSTTPATPLNAYIESSPIDIAEGDQYMLIKRILPDMTIEGDTENHPSVNMVLKVQNFPGENFSGTTTSTITRSATVPIQQYTRQCFVRLRGRSFVLRIESDELDMGWRLGSPRIDLIPDGRR